MKAKTIAILAVSLVLAAGCDPDQQEPQREATPKQAAAAPASDSGQAAQEAPAKSSIIRPSVLAETQDPPEPPEPDVKPLDITIPFADAEGVLPPDAPRLLDALLARPVMARGGCIVISGHTDSRGSDEQNVRASLRRAELVRDYLVERGVDPARIRLVALGERRPLAPNALPGGADYPQGRAKNRRVGVEVRLPTSDAEANCAAEDVAGSAA